MKKHGLLVWEIILLMSAILDLESMFNLRNVIGKIKYMNVKKYVYNTSIHFYNNDDFKSTFDHSIVIDS